MNQASKGVDRTSREALPPTILWLKHCKTMLASDSSDDDTVADTVADVFTVICLCFPLETDDVPVYLH